MLTNEKSYNDWSVYGDGALSEVIGRYVKHHRVAQNLSQDEVAQRAGMSRSTLSLLERGGKVNLSTLLQVLRVLDLLQVMNVFTVQENQVSPLEYAKLKKKARQKASPKSKRQDDQTDDLGW